MVKWPELDKVSKWGVFHRHLLFKLPPRLETRNAAVPDDPYITPISTKPYHCFAVFNFRRRQVRLFLFAACAYLPSPHSALARWMLRPRVGVQQLRTLLP